MSMISPETIELLQIAPIKILGLSPRSYNALIKNGVLTVGKIYVTDEDAFSEMRGLGQTCVDEIIKVKQLVERIIDEIVESDPDPEGREYFSDIYNYGGDLSEISISSLGVSDYIKALLQSKGIDNLRDLVGYSEDQILPMLNNNTKLEYELLDAVYERIANNERELRIKALMSVSDKSIRSLGLSSRPQGVLEREGVNTIGQLLQLDKVKLLTFPGLGATGLDDINDKLEKYADLLRSSDGEKSGQISMNIGEYWRSVSEGIPRNYELLVKYYNGGREETLDALGTEHGITRERVRQIIKKGEQKIRNAYLYGTIDEKIKEIIRQSASKMTEINIVYVGDEVFSNAGAVRLLASAIPESVQIYKSDLINGEWLVENERETSNLVESLTNLLLGSYEPMLLSDIKTIFGVDDDFVFSLKNIVEYDGYITLKNNRQAMGTDRVSIISRYLEALGRPASINEISENTGLTLNQVRGGIGYQGYFINVGKSIYDLANADYSDKDTSGLMENILVAEDRALKTSEIIDYVKIYDKTINKTQIDRVIEDADTRFRKSGDYILMKDWGDDKIMTFAPGNYEVTLEEAIIDIIDNSEVGEIFNTEDMIIMLADKYGESVSTNYNSVKQTLIKLRDEERITRVGQNTSGYYSKNVR